MVMLRMHTSHQSVLPIDRCCTWPVTKSDWLFLFPPLAALCRRWFQRNLRRNLAPESCCITRLHLWGWTRPLQSKILREETQACPAPTCQSICMMQFALWLASQHWGKIFAMEGVTSLANCPPGNHLLHLPHSLRGLSFESHFNESLENVELPSGLQSLTFGSHFNQSLAGREFAQLSSKLGFRFRFQSKPGGSELARQSWNLGFWVEIQQEPGGSDPAERPSKLDFWKRLQPEHGWSELAKRSSKLIFWRRFWPESRGCEISTRSSKVISRLVFQPEPRRSELAR